jgi:hypothetical protein
MVTKANLRTSILALRPDADVIKNKDGKPITHQELTDMLEVINAENEAVEDTAETKTPEVQPEAPKAAKPAPAPKKEAKVPAAGLQWPVEVQNSGIRIKMIVEVDVDGNTLHDEFAFGSQAGRHVIDDPRHIKRMDRAVQEVTRNAVLSATRAITPPFASASEKVQD